MASGKLATEISETLRYYTTHERKCRIDKVYLCGDFALVDGIDRLLSENLLQEVELWNPLENLHFASGLSDKDKLIKDGPCMAAALGLAMRAF